MARLSAATMAVLLAACGATDAPRTPTVELRGAGSTFLAPLLQQWIEIYRPSHPTLALTYDPAGSGEGVRRFIGLDLPASQAIDFGASDAAMSDAELAAAGGPTLMLPVTGGCVAVAYNLPHFSGRLTLSRDTLAAIFLGEITQWNDPRLVRLNANLATVAVPIRRVVRQDTSGTTFALSSHLAAINDRWRQDVPAGPDVHWTGSVVAASGSDGVASAIGQEAGSFGYLGLETAKAQHLSVAALQNKKGEFILPTSVSCSTALETWDLPDNLRAFVPDPDGLGAYPISTLSWILLHTHDGNTAVHTALWAFFRWCLQDGQKYASDHGYVPLPSPMATKALNALDQAAR